MIIMKALKCKPSALCTMLSFSMRRHVRTHKLVSSLGLDHGHTFLRCILHSINHVCNQSGKIPNLSLNGETEQSFKRATVSTLENHMFLPCIREREIGGRTQLIIRRDYEETKEAKTNCNSIDKQALHFIIDLQKIPLSGERCS